jgi:hypothetical protein
MQHKFHVEAITSLDSLETLRPYWQSAQWHPDADFEFFKLVVQSRSNILSPCVLVASRNGRPVAMLAGRFETVRLPVRFGYAALGAIAIRRMVLMVSGFMGEKTDEVLRCLLVFAGELLARERLDLVLLENVRVDSPMYEAARSTFGCRHYQAREDSPHWLMQLPQKWDEFLTNRSRKHRYWLKRLAVVLDREFAGQWNIKQYSSVEDALQFVEAAEAIAIKTYHRSLGVGFHRNDETVQRVAMDARRGQLRGYVLFIRGEPKAFWYCHVYKRVLHMAATGYDPDYRSYELGTILLMRVFQDHCGTDVEIVDFGLGDAGYKQRFGSEHFSETSLYIFPATVRGLWLNVSIRMMGWGNRCAKGVLNRLGVAGRLKTFWRRRLESKTGQSGAPPLED